MEKKLGLVLSGGGAKGAYQAGMLRALAENGLTETITEVAGTSIGAVTAVAYSLGGADMVQRMFQHFGRLVSMSHGLPGTSDNTLYKAREDVYNGKVTLAQFCTDRRYYQYDTAMVRRLMKILMPDRLLRRHRLRVTVCAYSLERARPEYFVLNELTPQEQRDIVLASASLPFVFPPVTFRGGHYLDGGVVPEICPDGAACDKIPLHALQGRPLDGILVNFLNPADTVDSSWVRPEIWYRELRPSTPLEAYPGAGTLDFAPEKLRAHLAKGYRDTVAMLAADTAWKTALR